MITSNVGTAMRLIEEKHVAPHTDILSWSNTIDLLAVSNQKGDLSLHRLSWQKVWTLPASSEEGSKINCISWRPDGKVIAVANNHQQVQLIDIENGDILHTINVEHPVSCLSWSQDSETDVIDPNSIIYEGISKQYLTNLPSISRNFGPMNKSSDENAEDCKKIGDQEILNILLIGTSTGYIFMKVFGIFPCGVINLNKFLPTLSCDILSLEMSPNIKNIIATVACKTSTDTNEETFTEIRAVVINTEALYNHKEELKYLAVKYGYILSLFSYMNHTMASIQESWENILLEMDLKLSSYAESVGIDGVSADLLDLLMFGTPSEELEVFLLQNLTEKGLKKLGSSVEISYSNIHKLVFKHLHAVSRNVVYHLSDLKGISLCHEYFNKMGFNSNNLTETVDTATAFMIKGSELQENLSTLITGIKHIFKWLHLAILRLSDDRISSDMQKMSQNDIRSIAFFLNSLSKQATETKGENNKKKIQFNLETIGQYLQDEDLKQVDTEETVWENFLKDSLPEHSGIILTNRNKSLVQLFNNLNKSVDKLFQEPENEINKEFDITKSIKLYEVFNTTDIKISTSYVSSKYILSFRDKSDELNTFHLIEFPENLLEINDVKYTQFYFSNEETSHKILDLQFYSDQVLSVLLQHQDENNYSSIFVQFPIKLINYENENSNKVQVDNILKTHIKKIDAVKILDSSTLRPIENLPASLFAVSGGRKVAVILADNRRRLRFFELEVEDEEEDDDENINTTKESENDSSIDTSTANTSGVNDNNPFQLFSTIETNEAMDTTTSPPM